MKLFNFNWIKVSSIVTMAVLLLTSCGNNSTGLLETVPAESDVVLTINAKKLIDNAGMKQVDGKWQLPEAFKSYQVVGDVDRSLEIMGKITAIADIESVVVFVHENNPYITFNITDASGIDKLLKDGILEEKPADGDYKVYKIDSGSRLMVKGSQGWVCEKNGDVREMVLKAENNPITEKSGVADYLLVDRAVNVVAYEKFFLNKWICGSGDVDGQEFNLSLQLMDNSGNLVEISKDLGEVDTEVLKYMPNGVCQVAALAIPKTFPWQQYLDMIKVSGVLSNRETAMAETVIGYLKKIDGTVSVGYALENIKNAADFRGFKNHKFVAMVKIDGNEIGSVMKELDNLAKMTGGKVNFDGKFYHADLREFGVEMDMYLGNVDGYLMLANYKPAASNVPAKFESVLDGKSFASASYMPEAANKLLRIPFGMEQCLVLDGNVFKANCKLINTDKPFIEAIAEFCYSVKVNEDYYKKLASELDGRSYYGPSTYNQDYYAVDTVALDTAIAY